MQVTYWLEHAWLGDRVASGVLLTATDGRITDLRTAADGPPPPGVDPHSGADPHPAAHPGTGAGAAPPAVPLQGPPSGATVLRGLTLPGLADAHSHAFHRALRGTVQSGDAPGADTGAGSAEPATRAPGTFWAWRDVMYRVAHHLTPDSYFDLARAVYGEMALAGITCVGEFHYLHHQADGTPYADPNAMGQALVAAAAEAGIRITLLDTVYLHGGLARGGYRPLEGTQRRFGDGSAQAWYDRWSQLKASDHARIGAAMHSVRAFSDRDGYRDFAQWTRDVPTHVHLSEQPAENEACVAVHGRTPTRLLADSGFWGPHATAVHATHLTGEDIHLLGRARSTVCMCPTTERDLADGIGPAPQLRRAGSPLSLGSDSHAVIDLLEEARAMELDERLRSRTRGHWTAAELLRAATADGHACLGWPEAGRLETGALADFTTIALDSVRTAGPAPRLGAETAVFAATAADVRHTVVAGRPVVRDGHHERIADVPAALAAAIAAVLPV